MDSMSTFIIAEAGVNHNGSLDIALKLIDEAKSAGADAIKFQTFNTQNIVCRNTEKAKYQKSTTTPSETQYEMLKRLELSAEEHLVLLEYAKSKRINFLSTPFDNESITLLDNLGLNIFKIPSGEITNLPYLRHIGALKKKVILSTGMANFSEVAKALDILLENGTLKKDITILQATTEYPTPFDEVNLHAMQTIGKKLEVKVGYSDHTLGIEVAIAAVALGASIIEKHFTLNRNMPGPDHKASLEPAELKRMVESIRHIEKALGNGVKVPSFSEKANMIVARKSIVAKKYITRGENFTEDNLTVKRPGTGVSPMLWDDLMGKKADRDYYEDEMILYISD